MHRAMLVRYHRVNYCRETKIANSLASNSSDQAMDHEGYFQTLKNALSIEATLTLREECRPSWFQLMRK
jgi:hypothetical protein